MLPYGHPPIPNRPCDGVTGTHLQTRLLHGPSPKPKMFPQTLLSQAFPHPNPIPHPNSTGCLPLPSPSPPLSPHPHPADPALPQVCSMPAHVHHGTAGDLCELRPAGTQSSGSRPMRPGGELRWKGGGQSGHPLPALGTAPAACAQTCVGAHSDPGRPGSRGLGGNSEQSSAHQVRNLL